ncbi:GntR family transcriptional regulator [Aurantimonas sp. VKM B-3413]|uniref:GntR family transcriptional regulator n=1 Tax=Aurantimonas sp. VKM B-3413 TaxID=2779401 RepID=UPI001E297222|nr:GntR family transcriptional regulator [Aurantimonas sp. VKM B-3413]MCB8838324.1 GntR family transcriptional regulator [Aurantimonas sp. VKM B-3413]
MSMSSTMAGPRPVRSKVIADGLEEEIISGALPAGCKLDETAVAQRFGVSRTPVREAFLTLASRSLVERMPYRGVVVCDLSLERIDQMFEAMGEIEGMCGRLAAGRMTTVERARLWDQQSAMEAMVGQDDFAAYDEANSLLHDMIYAGTHNDDVVEIAKAMRVKLAPFRRSQLQSRERVAESTLEHAAIVDAILEHDGVSAERHLRRHLLNSAKTFIAAHSARAQRAESGT